MNLLFLIIGGKYMVTFFFLEICKPEYVYLIELEFLEGWVNIY